MSSCKATNANVYRYEHRIINGSVHSHGSGDVVVYGPYAIFSHGAGHVRSEVISIDQLDQWAHDLAALARYLRALEAK